MARTELMSWIPKERRWVKRYRRVHYAVSPRQLKTAPTKEASREAANQWWTKKRAEIDESLGKAKEHPAHIVDRYELAIRNHRASACAGAGVTAWFSRARAT
jgi:hypothetical protein